jgi:hypothetical protein
MKSIKIDGEMYEMVEKLPYHGLGYPSVFIRMPDGNESVAVKQNGVWRFWTSVDRVEPLIITEKETKL